MDMNFDYVMHLAILYTGKVKKHLLSRGYDLEQVNFMVDNFGQIIVNDFNSARVIPKTADKIEAEFLLHNVSQA